MKQTEDAIRCLSHNVRWLREYHRLSRAGMAAMLRITEQELGEIEGGSIPDDLPIDVLGDIQRFFGVRVSDQFGQYLGEGEREISAPEAPLRKGSCQPQAD